LRPFYRGGIAVDVIQALKERRSINFFDPERSIPDDTLKELLEIANLAPSSFNLQPWKVIAVKDRGRKKVLRRCAFDQPKVEEASVVLIIVADPMGVEENRNAVIKSNIELGYMKPEATESTLGMIQTLYGPPNSPQRKVFAVKNASLFAMSVMVAARGLGLETHPMDGFDEGAIKKEFGIPNDKIVPMIIAVGYMKPGVTLFPRAYRRKVEDFVRFE